MEVEQLDEGSPSQADNWMADHRCRRTVKRVIIVMEELLDKGSSSQTANWMVDHRRRRTVPRGPSSKRNTAAVQPSRRTMTMKTRL